MKRIEDYLHLYLGCDCMWAIIVPGQDAEFVRCRLGIRELHNTLAGMSLCKPILRRLSSMTYDELREFTGQRNLVDEYCKDKIPKIAGSVFGLHNAISMYGSQDSIPWLLSKGFDLFGLIDVGLAIDAATV